jgi:hypothetical protein
MASREHSLRAQIATEHSRANPDPDRIADLQRERAAVRIADFARKVMADAPPLTREQRQDLAAVMLNGSGDDAA